MRLFLLVLTVMYSSILLSQNQIEIKSLWTLTSDFEARTTKSSQPWFSSDSRYYDVIISYYHGLQSGYLTSSSLEYSYGKSSSTKLRTLNDGQSVEENTSFYAKHLRIDLGITKSLFLDDAFGVKFTSNFFYKKNISSNEIDDYIFKDSVNNFIGRYWEKDTDPTTNWIGLSFLPQIEYNFWKNLSVLLSIRFDFYVRLINGYSYSTKKYYDASNILQNKLESKSYKSEFRIGREFNYGIGLSYTF